VRKHTQLSDISICKKKYSVIFTVLIVHKWHEINVMGNIYCEKNIAYIFAILFLIFLT
jgi:hypothetical protein